MGKFAFSVLVGLFFVSPVTIAQTAPATSVATSVPASGDMDSDGIHDSLDNCMTVANADQRDTNNDGFGNACDADYDNNGVVNGLDFGIFLAAFQGVVNPDTDCDGRSGTTVLDFSCFLTQYNSFPGPSGYENRDGDGWVDVKDNCVDTANPDQLDRDNDRIGDACDSQSFQNLYLIGQNNGSDNFLVVDERGYINYWNIEEQNSISAGQIPQDYIYAGVTQGYIPSENLYSLMVFDMGLSAPLVLLNDEFISAPTYGPSVAARSIDNLYLVRDFEMYGPQPVALMDIGGQNQLLIYTHNGVQTEEKDWMVMSQSGSVSAENIVKVAYTNSGYIALDRSGKVYTLILRTSRNYYTGESRVYYYLTDRYAITPESLPEGSERIIDISYSSRLNSFIALDNQSRVFRYNGQESTWERLK